MFNCLQLYRYHGHSDGSIALLFLAGYVSSCFLGRWNTSKWSSSTESAMDALNFYFGSLSGPLADKYGRRKMGQVRIVFLTSFLVEVCCFLISSFVRCFAWYAPLTASWRWPFLWQNSIDSTFSSFHRPDLSQLLCSPPWKDPERSLNFLSLLSVWGDKSNF